MFLSPYMYLLEGRVMPVLESPEVLTITFMLCLNLFVPLKCYIQYPFLSYSLLFMGSLHLFKHLPSSSVHCKTYLLDYHCQQGTMEEKDGQGVWDQHVHNAVFKIDNQQGPAIQHGKCYSVLCGSLNRKLGIWGEKGYLCMYD